MNTFTTDVIKIIQHVPRGKVLTYGRVALLAGSPRSARQVGWVLNGMTEKYQLPWHRIINSKGKISMLDPFAYMTQKTLLEDEGVEFINEDTIDLKQYMWDVSSDDFEMMN